MSILNGDEIIQAYKDGKIVIDPWDEKKVGANSYDVTLLPKLKVYNRVILDPRVKNPTRDIEIPEKGYLLKKGDFYLGSTLEYNANKSNDIVPMLEGRSSVARLGLTIHITAGFGDIGFCGRWTLEIVPAMDIWVYPGMPIGQLYWVRTNPTDRCYKGKYQDQKDIIASKLHMEIPTNGTGH